jgi:signal transduction histidine kinase
VQIRASASHSLPSGIRTALGSGKSLQGPVLLAIAYYLGAEAAFFVGTLSDKIFAPFWPPNVILFCVLLLVPQKRWWMYIAAAFPAHVIAEVGVGMPAGQLIVAFVTNCCVALINAIAVRRIIGDPPWFSGLRKASSYVLIAGGIGPATAALGGAFVPILGGGPIEKFWTYWAYWYVANALPNLTLGPVFLTWMSEDVRAGLESRWAKIEAAFLGVSLVVVCTLAFHISAGTVGSGFLPALLYSPLPFILWATLRFGTKGATTAVLIVTVVLIWRASNGPSLFIGADPETNVLALQVFLIGIAIPVLLLGASIDDLRQTGQRMRHLAGSVLAAQDEERRRIARELHDTTGQNLIAAGMLLSRVGTETSEAGQPPLQQLKEMMQNSVRDLRTVSYLLHPPLLDEGGLELALPHYIEGFSKRSGLKVDFELCPDLNKLPSDVALALFRVVQEALTNVARHSGSDSALIRLERKTAKGRRSLVLTISDTGRGLPKSAQRSALSGPGVLPSGGVGLSSMQERLAQTGGSLKITSDAGGTTVMAMIPDSYWSSPTG